MRSSVSAVVYVCAIILCFNVISYEGAHDKREINDDGSYSYIIYYTLKYERSRRYTQITRTRYGRA